MPSLSKNHWRTIIVALFLGLPLVACAALWMWWDQECGVNAFPQTYPGATIHTTSEHISAVVMTDSTTKTYTATVTIGQMRQFYQEQMKRICQTETITPFQITSSSDGNPANFIAECHIKGWENISQQQIDNAIQHAATPENFNLINRITHKTTQYFRVQLTALSPNMTHVEHFETFSTGC